MKNVVKDLDYLLRLTGLSESALAEELEVARSTLSRMRNGKTEPSQALLEKIYSFAYENPYHSTRINELKSQMLSDQYGPLLFHGARQKITFPLDLDHPRERIDLGRGFYMGETYAQALAYVCANRRSSVYVFRVEQGDKLKVKRFGVDEEWMLAVSYYRGELTRFASHPKIQTIIAETESADVVIAPIADNNMFEIMNRFARGLITYVAATRALSSSHLGMQHIFRTEKALSSLRYLDEFYLCEVEKKDALASGAAESSVSSDKSRISLEEYRREGHYIEELFK